MRTDLKRAGWSLLLAGILVGAIAGCSAETPATPDSGGQVSPSGEPVIAVGDEPYGSATLTELADASSAVVRGVVESSESGIALGESKDMTYTAFEVRVSDQYRGDAADVVKVYVSTTSQGRPLEIVGRTIPEPGEDSIWFLTTIDPQFGVDGYVLSIQAGGILVERDGAIEHSHESTPLEEASELGSLDAVASFLKR